MAQSMTAFARSEVRLPFCTLSCEIRSVNQRFLDPVFRLPETLRIHEPVLREQLRQRITRGKLECSFKQEQLVDQASNWELDSQLVQQLASTLDQVVKITGHTSSLNPLDILRWPGVMKSSSEDPTELEGAVADLFSTTLDQLVSNRQREGDKLCAIITQRLDDIGKIVIQVHDIVPELLSANRKRILNRLQDLKQELDSGRIEQELVFIAQKADVEEELDRLETHIGEVRSVLKSEGAIGRRLDFLMQELNREANTLSAKSIAADTSLQSVELKVLIEQMREQIQNIE